MAQAGTKSGDGRKPLRDVLAALLVGCAVGTGVWLAATAADRSQSAAGRPFTKGVSGDPAQDCDPCPAHADIRVLRVRPGDGATHVTVMLGAAPKRGSVVTIWLREHPAHPLRLVRGAAAGSWGVEVPAGGKVDVRAVRVRESDALLTVRVPLREAGPLAASTAGDRAPDVGYVELRGDVLREQRLPDGDTARRSLERIASAQARMELLDAGQRMLAVMLLARQVVTGTHTYSGTDSEGPVRLVLTIDGGTLQVRQDFYRRAARGGWRLDSSRTAVTDGERFCQFPAGRGRPQCSTDRVDEEPATQVLALQHGASRVRLQPAARRVLGRTARCQRILETVPDGPNIGERCAFPDGVIAYLHLRASGQRLTLERSTDKVAADAFTRRMA